MHVLCRALCARGHVAAWLRARIATSQVATGAVGLRALAVKREIYACSMLVACPLATSQAATGAVGCCNAACTVLREMLDGCFHEHLFN